MTTKAISKFDSEYLVHLYIDEGYSINKLARMLGRGVNTVKKILLENNIEVRVSGLASNQQFRDWHSQGKSVSEIALLLGTKKDSITKVLKMLGLVEQSYKRITEKECELIVQLYSECNSLSMIGKKLNLSKPTVAYHLRAKNTVMKNQLFYNKYTFNNKFFDKIDSEVKAYFLGYLYADGYNDEKRNKVVFGQAEKDKESVQKFKDALNATHPISVEKRKGNRQSFYKITISSKYFSQALKNQGCQNAKTFNLTFPDLAPELVNHFIRGYFDGDGSIWFTAEGKPRMSITGLDTFLLDLQKVLVQECNVNLTKLACRRNNTIKEIRYGGVNNIKKISDYLYKDATIYLERKYLKMT